MREPTGFESRVYEAVSRVPRGCVTTYALVATHLSCGSAQAVGQALKRNPFAPDVPCHRVIASSLRLGGFAGESSGPALKRKLALLSAEGVEFARGALADPQRVYRFRQIRKRVPSPARQMGPRLLPGGARRGRCVGR